VERGSVDYLQDKTMFDAKQSRAPFMQTYPAFGERRNRSSSFGRY